MSICDPRPALVRVIGNKVRRFAGLAAAFGVLGLGLGGCAQQPRQVVAGHGSEYFPSSVYGPASRRVIVDGQPVPHGGGQYLVGKPYTVAGHTYYPNESHATQVGSASWYGDAFHGRLTANGEIYDRDGFTAASPTMPLPSYARVTNLRNNYSMIVRVNDRGPYASNRIMDVSRRVAEALDYKRYGTTKLKVEYVGRASLSGSDDAKLFATLRTNGPAPWEGQPTMVAEAPRPRTRVASIEPYAPAARTDDETGDPDEPRYEPRRPQRASRDLPPEQGAMPRRRFAEPYDPEAVRHVISARDDDDHPIRNIRTAYARPSISEDRAVDYPRHREAQRVALADPYLPPHRPRLAEESVRGKIAAHGPVLPPSRPMDLGTIPGAASQIHARRDLPRLRMARSRDD